MAKKIKKVDKPPKDHFLNESTGDEELNVLNESEELKQWKEPKEAENSKESKKPKESKDPKESKANKDENLSKKLKTKKQEKSEILIEVESAGKKSKKCTSTNPAPGGTIGEGVHWFQLLPIAFFTACIIMVVRMANYERPMDQFYWTNSGNQLSDFFSYYKMVLVIVCGALALVFFAYRIFAQSLAIKKSYIYIPMGVYSLFVLLSYATSEYKEFALLGYNDRFEGTLVLLSYMVMLFYIINSINTEKAVKWVIYPVAATSALLGLLGVSQSMNKDLFRTPFGQKLISPNLMTEGGQTIHQLIDQAMANGELFFKFTFTDQIYQTVYNINYVSFYLTLLIPIFGLIFINCMMKGKEEKIWKKILWAVLFALAIYNLIGSASSGGYLGMGVIVLIAIILLNKRILSWWKPLAILIVITIIMGGVTYERWLPEITGALSSATGTTTEATKPVADTKAAPEKSHLDYFINEDSVIKLSVDGNEFQVLTNPESPLHIAFTDSAQNIMGYKMDAQGVNHFEDDRLKNVGFGMAIGPDDTSYVIIILNNEKQWQFAIKPDGTLYTNEIGRNVALENVPHIGWENNQAFGSGRGYIWSRTLPMIKDTILLGTGADTYCLYFPQNDYVGKYNAAWDINMIVDKPHNMYMGMWTGTGGISCLAFLALVLMYAIQSIKVYRGRRYDRFIDFAGVGLFLGVIGFAVTGFVDDSSVSVMPMFYGLLGTGIAVNIMLGREMKSILKEDKK